MSYWFNILLRINIQNTIQCILLIIIQNRNRVHYVSNSFSLDQQLQTELTTQWATLRCSSKWMCCSWFILIHSFKQNHFQISLFNQFSLFNFLSTSSTSSIIKILLNQWIIKMVQYWKKRVVKIYCDSVFKGFAVLLIFFVFLGSKWFMKHIPFSLHLQENPQNYDLFPPHELIKLDNPKNFTVVIFLRLNTYMIQREKRWPNTPPGEIYRH